jgi:hypothetical protein
VTKPLPTSNYLAHFAPRCVHSSTLEGKNLVISTYASGPPDPLELAEVAAFRASDFPLNSQRSARMKLSMKTTRAINTMVLRLLHQDSREFLF